MILLALLFSVFLDDSIVPILKHNFDSYFVLSGNSISQSPDANIPVAIGSLIKPFTALAYAKQYGPAFPMLQCDGKGPLDLPHALALSCNSYFQRLAARIDPKSFAELLRSYGIVVSPDALTPNARIGLGESLLIAPAALLKAYAALFDREEDPAVKVIWKGFALAATNGTAKSWKGRVLAKTGTAFCPKDEGDGWALVAYPISHPKTIILVRNHRQTGAVTTRKLAQALGPLFGVR